MGGVVVRLQSRNVTINMGETVGGMAEHMKTAKFQMQLSKLTWKWRRFHILGLGLDSHY